MATIKDDDLLPDERALLEGKSIDEPAAQLDPVDDDNAAEPAAVEVAAEPEAPAKAEPEPTAAAPEADPAEKIDAQAAEGTSAARPLYDAPQARDFDAERKALRTQKSEIDSKWSEGELSDEARADKLAEIDDQLDTLLIEKTQAQTIKHLNEQAIVQSQQQVLAEIREASAKAKELDYNDVKVATAYDKMLRDAVMADPENAGKPFAELAKLAHQGLCAVRGVRRAAPAAEEPKPAAAAASATPSIRATLPQTLHSLPPASSTPIENSAMTAIAAMTDPDEAEAALAAMPASQRNELLRSTIATKASRR